MAADKRISVVWIFVSVLELKYAVTNFKIYLIFYRLRKQNTENIFVPLDGT